MAEALLQRSNLRLNFVVGENEKGEDVVRAKSYNNINPEATAEQILSTSEALASLQIYPLQAVFRNGSLMIVEGE